MQEKELTQEEFDKQFRLLMDAMIESLANNDEVASQKFFGLACFLENVSFFSPVLWGLMQKNSK